MKIQDHINSTDLDMTEIQVKAFFLGVLCAEKPLPYHKALIELLSETPEAKGTLEGPFKTVWDELQKSLKSELTRMFPDESDIHAFLELAKDQLDFFLTGMSLSGTNADNCDDEELAEFINELEELVEDMEDFLADSEASEEDGEDFREFLFENWKNFASSRQ
jgi:uncharacterized protein YgfB (UPF0149 family)